MNFSGLFQCLEPLDLWMVDRADHSSLPCKKLNLSFLIDKIFLNFSKAKQEKDWESLKMPLGKVCFSKGHCALQEGQMKQAYFRMFISLRRHALLPTSPVRHGNVISTGNYTFSLSNREKWSRERYRPKGSVSCGGGPQVSPSFYGNEDSKCIITEAK